MGSSKLCGEGVHSSPLHDYFPRTQAQYVVLYFHQPLCCLLHHDCAGGLLTLHAGGKELG